MCFTYADFPGLRFLNDTSVYSMMTSQKTLIVLLLVLGIASAFNVSDYLYPNEANASVTYSNFSLSGAQYSIVAVNGVATFLLDNGNIVSDGPTIKSTLSNYYMSYYFPSTNDLDNLQGLITTFNASRNDGHMFKGKEEYACRGILFIDGRVTWDQQPVLCRNQSDASLCQVAANLMFEYLTSATNAPPVADPTALLLPIENFGFASYQMDQVLGNDVQLLESAENDTSQVAPALSYINSTFVNLSIDKDTVENSLFTFNQNDTVDSSHWGLCPDIRLDTGTLQLIHQSLVNLSVKMAPYNNLDSVSGDLAEQHR